MNDGHTVKLTPGAGAPNGDVVTVANPSARAVAEPPSSSAPPVVAGYHLLHVIGRGGMGVVWQAHEQRFDRQVALKVHGSSASSEEVAQLWSEAYLAAKIGDPGIVRVHDVGFTLEGLPYYSMELVDGTDLSARIAEGPLPPQRALTIAADIARAAGAAHAHGIVHRDLKPKNVIVDVSGRARVLDFGIAVNARSGKDLFEGLMCGSPPYMSPEQITGAPVSPQTDVHAVGVILFEMLTGERPFSAANTDALLVKIASEEPPKPRSIDRQIHEDVEEIILRCLDKDPQKRFANGRALHEALSAVIEGRPLEHVAPRSSAYLPRVRTSRPPDNRPKREDATKHFKWSWTLKTPPEKLWPYVSNTDRLNRAFGLSPVDFTDEPRSEGGGTTRTGRMSALGMAIEWQEFPFEWVKNREHSVFRWYRSGPIAALWNKVTLAPSADGGTELTHEISLLPRGILGQVASFLEVSQKASKGIDRSYRHLDEVLASGRHEDPFEEPHAARDEDRRHVSEIVGKLSNELGFRRELADRFAAHVLETPSVALSRMRPYELADAWDEDRAEVLDLMLHAAGARLLEPSWDTICPKCMLAHETVSALAHVTSAGHCTACASSYERDLADSVELVFRPHPRVRTTERVTYCAGAPALRPHVLVQQVLYAGESRTLDVEIPRGTYRITGTGVAAPWELTASAAGFESQVEAIVGERAHGRPQIVRAGEVTLTLVNDTDYEQTIRLEIPGAREDGVSGASAITHPTFRELFGEDLLAYGQHLSVSHMAFVFASIGNREELFEKLGDAGAVAAFGKLDAAFSKVVVAEHGSMVPASLDLFVAAFASSTRAIRAALAFRHGADAAGLGDSLQIACHEGRCLALTRGDKAEFFGQTLHRGASLLLDTPRGAIALSAQMAADRAVAAAVHESNMSIHLARAISGPYKGRPIAIVTDDAAPVSLGAQRVANAG
jgi:serine/threonine protein kinase